MDPSTIQALGTGLKSGSDTLGKQMIARAEEKKAKESKRRTLAEFLNAVLQREFDAGEGMRKRGADLSGQRAQAMQNVASQYVQALR